MLEEFYLFTTPLSVILLIVSIAFQNRFPEFFRSWNKEDKGIKITIDSSDWAGMSLFIFTCLFVLFAPVVNVLCAVIYSIMVLTEYAKEKVAGK